MAHDASETPAPLQGGATSARVPLSHEHNLPAANVLYLTAAQVRARYGGISDMTLWRWLRNTELGFPKPRRINRLRYWKTNDLAEWERRRPN
jgi:predicted DNA-binding transcriptional regulator AlpA